jgi:hypothetical protein
MGTTIGALCRHPVASGWIIGENLRPFLDVLLWQSGKRLADTEWDATRCRFGRHSAESRLPAGAGITIAVWGPAAT